VTQTAKRKAVVSSKWL